MARRVDTYDAVTYLAGDRVNEVTPGVRRIMSRWLYNWAREGKITNYGSSAKAMWDLAEVLDAYRHSVRPYTKRQSSAP